jgi:hypothetical protein
MLEQAYDTKELNRVQRRLMARGKLVGNVVNHWVTVRLARVLAMSSFPGSVDQTSSLRTLLPGYQRVFPHIHSMILVLVKCSSGTCQCACRVTLTWAIG